MFLIIVGLYSFLRAKSKEFTQIGSPNVGDAEAPLPEIEVITPRSNMELPILARESARFQSTTIEVASPILKQDEDEEEEKEKQCI